MSVSIQWICETEKQRSNSDYIRQTNKNENDFRDISNHMRLFCNSHNKFCLKKCISNRFPNQQKCWIRTTNKKNMMMMRLVLLSKVALCICQISVHGNFCEYFVDCTWFAGCYVTHWYHMFCVFIQYLHCIRTRFHHRNHITPMSNVFQRTHNR